jgi:hypothetical protein
MNTYFYFRNKEGSRTLQLAGAAEAFRLQKGNQLFFELVAATFRLRGVSK